MDEHKRRKLVWIDDGQQKVAYGQGLTITGSGTVIIFHGEKGDIILSSAMEFTIT